MISESYLELNRKLHADNADYGTTGRKYVDRIRCFLDTRDILDYGCGKRTLEAALGFQIKNYDPAIFGCEVAVPAQFVACLDVMEHIEPEYLEEVLQDIRRCTLGVCYMTIATKPAKKVLSDGRNAHLIQKNVRWWLGRLSRHFGIDGCVLYKNGFEVFLA